MRLGAQRAIWVGANGVNCYLPGHLADQERRLALAANRDGADEIALNRRGRVPEPTSGSGTAIFRAQDSPALTTAQRAGNRHLGGHDGAPARAGISRSSGITAS